ncbi:G-type lectin S-receptor-like serine/threonine-protein kinase SD1-1 [Linum grandiflorum]
MVKRCDQREVLSLVHIALLCVQKKPDDQPSMPAVAVMIGGDGELSEPKLSEFFMEMSRVVTVTVSKLLFESSSRVFDCRLLFTDFRAGGFPSGLIEIADVYDSDFRRGGGGFFSSFFAPTPDTNLALAVFNTPRLKRPISAPAFFINTSHGLPPISPCNLLPNRPLQSQAEEIVIKEISFIAWKSRTMEESSPVPAVESSTTRSIPIRVRLVTAEQPHQQEEESDVIDDVSVEIEGLTLADETNDYEICVAGLLMTSRNTNMNIIQDRLAMLCRPGHGMAAEDLGDKLYLFRFHHPHDLRWVIDNRPWTFDNALLVGTVLGSFVGKFLDFDNKLKFSRETPYMRIRVLLDVTVPLPIDKKVILNVTVPFTTGLPILISWNAKWDASPRAEYRKTVVSGGAQWLVQADKTGNQVDGSSSRTALTELSQNTLARGRIISRSVVALRKNMGVSLWRPMGEEDMHEEEKSDDAMDGIEIQDDSKRRRVGSTSSLVIRECDINTESRSE